MLKHKMNNLAGAICAVILLPFTALSATDLTFEESHFRYSQEALANAQKEIKVVDIDVSMNNTDARILFLKDPNDKSTFAAGFSIDGEELKGRIKSFGSSTRALRKKSIILKVKGSTWKGYKNIALNSMSSDGSMMRGWMAWEMMRDMGMMVPETNYVRLTINGEFIGYFLYIEWLGNRFLERNGYDSSSELYQASDNTYCGDFRHKSDTEKCWAKLAPRGGDHSSMKAFAKQVQSAPMESFDSFIASSFDDDSLINWIVANTLTSNGDTYNKNYFMIKSGQSKKWKVIPWDYDLTFGQTFDQFVPFPESLFNDRFQYYYTPDLGVFNPMKAKAFLNERLKGKIYKQLKHMIGKEKDGPEKTFGWFSPTVMNARIENLARVLEAGQVKQKHGARSPEAFVEQYDAVSHFGIARPFYLEANLFSTFEWSYRNTPQMKEYIAFTKGEDLYPEDIAKAESDAAIASQKDAEKRALHAKVKEEYHPPGEAKQALDEHEFMAKLLMKPYSGRAATADLGKSLIVYDPGYGYFLTRLDFKSPFKIVDFQTEAEGFKPPMYMFEGVSPDQCIQRSWVLFSRIPSLSSKADVTFEYFDEHSQKNELGGIKNEHKVNLWVHTGENWKPLRTEVNARSNTLTVNNFQINAGRIYRFIACAAAESPLWSVPVNR
ncbi:CotH protein [Mariprofundus aestuarium]|uniref:CotH protein n=1 Tax=Mariprofundus aestuarium TaxID=1921086 RepID=A0A2K8L7J3_MARES|nr:CotH kinase family protein [Mariprofundus aestuarium]ATX80246.1 CotH protein [Mariprofundus aestuarium]